jgi:hypothetical protein
MNLFFDDIKLKNGDLLPIDATLVIGTTTDRKLNRHPVIRRSNLDRFDCGHFAIMASTFDLSSRSIATKQPSNYEDALQL